MSQQPTSESYMIGPQGWPIKSPDIAQAKAVIQLDLACASYTVWLDPDNLRVVWATLVQPDPTKSSLIDQLEATRPTLHNDRATYRPRIDYAFSRDANRILLEIGMSLHDMSATQLLTWKETVAMLLTGSGARTLGMKIDALANYITVNAGEWP